MKSNRKAIKGRSSFATFHEARRKKLLAYIEQRVARHVKSGGNDTPYYRTQCAYDGMRDLPKHSDREIWDAAWKACEEDANLRELKYVAELATQLDTGQDCDPGHHDLVLAAMAALNPRQPNQAINA